MGAYDGLHLEDYFKSLGAPGDVLIYASTKHADDPFNEDEFRLAYWLWLRHGRDTRPVNEAIERQYRGPKYEAPKCPHGKTYLTCDRCYIGEWSGGAGGWGR